MRFVFVGSGTLAVLTGRMLATRGHEVVVIERDAAVIDEVEEELDVGFIHGDGTRPAILREADPQATDLLFCLTHDDQSNIIASLVARSLGYRRVVTKIEDPELEHICVELGLAESLVPMHAVGRYLADMAEGQNIFEVSGMLRGAARLFAFRVGEANAMHLRELALPQGARAICVYRADSEFLFAEPDLRLKPGDEVVVLTRADGLKALHERFAEALAD
ncbi:MAG: TrkA family potassium uptake protein [Chromatiaceae bacterium]|jgi:trk system potassium uptake protein TrkA|nr:TrkA family potassium uptake protein [Chromatiaceae bacterium]